MESLLILLKNRVTEMPFASHSFHLFSTSQDFTNAVVFSEFLVDAHMVVLRRLVTAGLVRPFCHFLSFYLVLF